MAQLDGAKYVRGVELIEDFPIGSGVVIDAGDLVKLSGGLVKPLAATTDNLVFIGVARGAHAATDGADRIAVAIANGGAVYRMTLDAASTFVVGNKFQAYTSDPEKKLVDSDTDYIAIAVKEGTSVTETDVILCTPATHIAEAS